MSKSKTPFSRRDFIKSCAAAAGAASVPYWATGQAPAAPSGKRPNILLLSTDQWHTDAFGYRGCSHVDTPNADRIAQMGVDFKCSYASDPVCSPARASWNTGRMPSEHRVIGNGFPLMDDMVDMGQWFGDHGYETVHLGKWHIPNRNPKKSYRINSSMHPSGQYSDQSLAESARAYLLNRKKDMPFLMHVAMMNPHDICQVSVLPTNRGVIPFDDPDALPPLPDNFSARPTESETFKKKLRQSWRRSAYRTWDENDWRLYRWMYFRYCNMVDSTLGLVLDALEASGEAENTLLVFTSDHGEGNGHHGLATKSFLYEESARVPMVAVFPDRLPAGSEDTRTFTSSIDLMPTFCAVAGIPQPPKLCGIDFLKDYSDGTRSRDALVTEASFGGHMVRTDRYKYITYDDDPHLQLFDLQEDPGETVNIAGQAKNSTIIAEHAAMLSDFQDSLTPFPMPPGGTSQIWRDYKNRS